MLIPRHDLGRSAGRVTVRVVFGPDFHVSGERYAGTET
jgi:hypothetical protein